MTDRAGEAIEVELAKYLFGYPAGKARLAPKLAPLIPEHKVYTEPFCGSAAVFLAKPQSDVEVLCDRSEVIAGILGDVAALTDRELEKIAKLDWTGDAERFAKLKSQKPASRVQRVYRHLYVARFSRFRDMNREFDAAHAGVVAQSAKRIAKARDRLANAKIVCGDYEPVVNEYDGPEAFHFLDPPYVGYDVHVGENEFDEERFGKVLRSIKGKFLVTYGVRGKLDTSGFVVKQIFSTGNNIHGTREGLPTMLIANYDLDVGDADDVAEVDPQTGIDLERLGSGIARMRDLLAGVLNSSKAFVEVSPAELALEELEQIGKSFAGDVVDVPATPFALARFCADETTRIEKATPALSPLTQDITSRLGVVQSLIDSVVKLDQPGSAWDGKRPSTDEPTCGVLQYHVVGSSAHCDLRIDAGEVAIGWRLALERGAVVDVTDPGKRDELVASFTVDGGPHTRSLRRIIPAIDLGIQSRGWLRVDGDVSGEGEPGGSIYHPGAIVTLARFSVEWGLDGEFFLSGGLTGILQVTSSGVRIVSDAIPRVLERSSVAAGIMPPPGASALPRTLAEQIPEDFRYWDVMGDEARVRRDALVEWGQFGPQSIRIVDGHFRRVVTKIFLPDADIPAPDVVDLPTRVASLLEDGTRVAESFAKIEAAPDGAVAYFDVGEIDDAGGCDLLSVHGDWIATAKDSSETRRILSAAGGRLFKIRPEPGFVSDAVERVFAANFPIRASKRIDWLEQRSESTLTKVEDVPFVGSMQTWTQADGTVARQVMHLMLEVGTGLDTWILEGDPREGAVPAVHVMRSRADLATFSGDCPPGTRIGGDLLNDTKGLDSTIEPTVKGTAKILERSSSRWKLELSGDLAGSYELDADMPGGSLWTMSPTPVTAKSYEVADVQTDQGSIQVQQWGASTEEDAEEFAPLALFEPEQVDGYASVGEMMRAIDVSGTSWLVEPVVGGVEVIVERDGEGRSLLYSVASEPMGATALPATSVDLESLPAPYVLVCSLVGMRGESDDQATIVIRRALFLPDTGNLVTTSNDSAREALESWFGDRRLDHVTLIPCERSPDAESIHESLEAMPDATTEVVVLSAQETYHIGGKTRGGRAPVTDVFKALRRESRILKTDDERYVLGVVLEPETVDAQNDIYSVEEVRQAAHNFMAQFQNMGLMHRSLVNDGVQLVESYLAPVDFELDGVQIKRGTWLMGVKIVDDALWQAVKSGKLTGFSIGGSAVRMPDRAAA